MFVLPPHGSFLLVNQEHLRANAIYSCVLNENLSARHGLPTYKLLVRERLQVPERTWVIIIALGRIIATW